MPPGDDRELLIPLPEKPVRKRTWNEHVYAALSVIAAIVILMFLTAILWTVARWAAHVTGVLPL